MCFNFCSICAVPTLMMELALTVHVHTMDKSISVRTFLDICLYWHSVFYVSFSHHLLFVCFWYIPSTGTPCIGWYKLLTDTAANIAHQTPPTMSDSTRNTTDTVTDTMTTVLSAMVTSWAYNHLKQLIQGMTWSTNFTFTQIHTKCHNECLLHKR